MPFPTQFNRQTFTHFQDAVQRSLFWSLSWLWKVALTWLFPLHYNTVILFYSMIAPVSIVCTFLWLSSFTRLWTSWKQQPCPIIFICQLLAQGRRKTSVEEDQYKQIYRDVNRKANGSPETDKFCWMEIYFLKMEMYLERVLNQITKNSRNSKKSEQEAIISGVFLKILV